MPSDAFLQIRTALDSTTETTGGDTRSGVGAVFIQKEIDRMIIETYNNGIDFVPLVPRKTMRQLAYIWNLRINRGSTSKVAFYSDGAGGTPYPSQYLQLYAQAKSLRSDYEVTGLTMAAASSYFDALNEEARVALQAMAQIEEQAFICGDDTDTNSVSATICENGAVGVTGSYKGLYQLMTSAIAVADGSDGGLNDTTAAYGTSRSATTSNRGYKLNVGCVCTAGDAQNPISVQNLDDAITTSNIKGGKGNNRIFLCSEKRYMKIKDLIAPQGRFVIGAQMAKLDGGAEVLSWQGIKIISSRYMALTGVTANGTNSSFADTDNSVYLLDMDNIVFMNVAGVDRKHVPIMGADANQRNDVEGGYYKTYGTLVMKRFDTQVLIYNLDTL